MIDFRQDQSGVAFTVRVQPKASADRIAGEHAGGLKLAVTAPPEAGKANEAVVKLLAKKLNVSKSSVRILSGAASRQKVVHVDNLTADAVRKLLAAGRPRGK